ncbi:MAG: hypothetical protein ACT4PW_01285 [Acidimicrobiia bacterium]
MDSAELVDGIGRRVVEAELARRLPGRRPGPSTVGAAAPPQSLALLVPHAFPLPVLERRLRFLRAAGWYPVEAPAVTPGRDPALPGEAGIADHVAAVLGASRIVSDGPDIGALAWALGRPLVGTGPAGTDVAVLSRYFDDLADQVDPGWRRLTPRPPTVVARWARMEAATVAADRWFGRGRGGRAWEAVADGVGRLGRLKRWFG